VGKSVFFTEHTGIHAISSNYVGTTVTYMQGHLPIGDKEYTLIDVPGTYSLSPSSDAEAVAVKFIEEGAKAIICVLDASNLERNLALALELRKCKIPVVYTLNLSDIAERRGIEINHKLLAQELSAPVVPTVAVKKSGISELINTLQSVTTEGLSFSCENCETCPLDRPMTQKQIWETAKQINKRVSKKMTKEPGFLDKLGESMTKPFPGIFIAILVMAILIGVVVGGGRGLRALFLLRLFSSDGGIVVEFFRNLFGSFIPEGVFLNILTGEFGIFVISFEWILALIFPYVLMF
jgi:ferrous iron transport protein B